MLKRFEEICEDPYTTHKEVCKMCHAKAAAEAEVTAEVDGATGTEAAAEADAGALPQDVSGLLLSLGIAQLTAQFEKEQIDMDALKMMNDDDLKELGIAMGPRKKLSKWISEQAK